MKAFRLIMVIALLAFAGELRAEYDATLGVWTGNDNPMTVGQTLRATSTGIASFGVLEEPGGGTGTASPLDNRILIGRDIGTGEWQQEEIPECTMPNVIQYDESSNTLSCVAMSGVDLTSGVTGVLPAVSGGTDVSTATDDNVLVGNGTAYQSKAVPDCNSDATRALQYDDATNAFSCQVITAAASPGGSANQFQFNDSGTSIGGTSNLLWQDANDRIQHNDSFELQIDADDNEASANFLFYDGGGTLQFVISEDGEVSAGGTQDYPSGGFTGYQSVGTLTNVNVANPTLRGLNVGNTWEYDTTLSMGLNFIAGAMVSPTVQSESGIASGTETAASLYAIYSRPNFEGTNGPREIQNLVGLFLQPEVDGGTVQNVYGVRIQPIEDASSTIDNAYGVYIFDQKGDTNSWGIYQDTGTDSNYFAGDTSFGTTTFVSGTTLNVDGGYIQASHVTTAANPASADCDDSSEEGRLAVVNQTSSGTNKFCVCVSDASSVWGWECETV